MWSLENSYKTLNPSYPLNARYTVQNTSGIDILFLHVGVKHKIKIKNQSNLTLITIGWKIGFTEMNINKTIFPNYHNILFILSWCRS